MLKTLCFLKGWGLSKTGCTLCSQKSQRSQRAFVVDVFVRISPMVYDVRKCLCNGSTPLVVTPSQCVVIYEQSLSHKKVKTSKSILPTLSVLMIPRIEVYIFGRSNFSRKYIFLTKFFLKNEKQNIKRCIKKFKIILLISENFT